MNKVLCESSDKSWTGSGLPVGVCQWFEFYSAAAAALEQNIYDRILNWNPLFINGVT